MPSLQDRDADWAATAPIVVTRQFTVPAPPRPGLRPHGRHRRLARTGSRACARSAIDAGPATGVGAVRTVWVGTTRVQERFVLWEPGARMSFVLTSMNVPGLVAMVEDYALAPGPIGSAAPRVSGHHRH